jgi:hypothetical protein
VERAHRRRRITGRAVQCAAPGLRAFGTASISSRSSRRNQGGEE